MINRENMKALAEKNNFYDIDSIKEMIHAKASEGKFYLFIDYDNDSKKN